MTKSPELVWVERRYPPKAILGTAYEYGTVAKTGRRRYHSQKVKRRVRRAGR